LKLLCSENPVSKFAFIKWVSLVPLHVGEKDAKPSKDVEEETWTHEKVKAITDEMVYVAKDTTVANAIVAKATNAPRAGRAACSFE
jgi:hypothetical protein